MSLMLLKSAPRPTTYVVRPPRGRETLGAVRRLFLKRRIAGSVSRLLRRTAALLPGGLLAACGGGLSIGIGIGGDFDFSAPSVSVAAAQASVQAGQSVLLVAAAADENGIESVAFYRLDGGGAVLLGTDGFAPFEWQAVAPTDGRASMFVFARATDGAGNRADSAAVKIVITP